MASELELVAKQKFFISKIPWFFSASRNQLSSLIKFFCLATNSNSDAIFVFPEVDLHNRILISSQNSDLEKSTSSTARPKLWSLGGRRLVGQIGWKLVCDLMVTHYSTYVCPKTQRASFIFSARPTTYCYFIRPIWPISFSGKTSIKNPHNMEISQSWLLFTYLVYILLLH